MDLSEYVVVTTSVLAVPPHPSSESPPVLQIFEDRADAIRMAERLSERGWDVYLGEKKDEGKPN